MAWCPDRAALALGTVKGSGVVYDCDSRATIPLALGRNGKPVTCATWSSAALPGGLVALGCKSGLLLLCRAADGSLARSVQLKGAVSQLQFCCGGDCSEGSAIGQDGVASPAGSGALLAANVGRRAVCIWQLPEALASDIGTGGTSSAGPFELAFREGYGEVEHYCWVHPRLLVAGFSSGQVVAVSLSGGPAPGAGAGTELFSLRCLHTAVAGIGWCARSSTLAVGGGTQLAVLNCHEQEVTLDAAGVHSLDLEAGQRVAGLQYSPDGKLLTLCSTAGRLLHLLATPTLLHGAWGSKVAYVDPASAIGEVLLVAEPHGSPVALPLPLEPELLALGPAQLAAAAGNKVGGCAEQPVEPDGCRLAGTEGHSAGCTPEHCCLGTLLGQPGKLGPGSERRACWHADGQPLGHVVPGMTCLYSPCLWMQVWFQAVEPEAASGLLPAPLEAEYPTPICWLRINSTCVLILGEGGRVFVQPAPGASGNGGEVVELR